MSRLDDLFLDDGGNGIRRVSDRFAWGTVASTVPLAVRMDGEDAPLAITPTPLISPQRLAAGARVWCQFNGRSMVVLGSSNGGTPYDTDPMALSLKSGWIPFGGGYADPTYYISNGRVYVDGLAKGGADTAGTTMAELPIGFRPSAFRTFNTVAEGATVPTCRLDVSNTGLIIARTNVQTGYTGFDGINFRLG